MILKPLAGSFGTKVNEVEFFYCKDESHKTICSRTEITAREARN